MSDTGDLIYDLWNVGRVVVPGVIILAFLLFTTIALFPETGEPILDVLLFWAK